jgi:hypothetical protein
VKAFIVTRADLMTRCQSLAHVFFGSLYTVFPSNMLSVSLDDIDGWFNDVSIADVTHSMSFTCR